MTSRKSEEPLIRVSGLSAGYDGEVILKDVNFEVGRGEVFAIMGGSGCGKSTLLRCMIGLLKPLAGSVIVAGEDLSQASRAKELEILKKIGVTYQSGALFGSLSLLENVSLPLEELTCLPRPAAAYLARLKLELVGLGPYCALLPSQVSGGMQKRAAIARALALDPEIVFLDEPSAGLDPLTSAELDQLILTLAKNLKTTFVLVTHEVQSVLNTADRVVMLRRKLKGVAAQGDPRVLRENSGDEWVRRFLRNEVEAA